MGLLVCLFFFGGGVGFTTQADDTPVKTATRAASAEVLLTHTLCLSCTNSLGLAHKQAGRPLKRGQESSPALFTEEVTLLCRLVLGLQQPTQDALKSHSTCEPNLNQYQHN